VVFLEAVAAAVEVMDKIAVGMAVLVVGQVVVELTIAVHHRPELLVAALWCIFTHNEKLLFP
jgi:hypothetical protein